LKYLGYQQNGEPADVLRLMDRPLPLLSQGMVLVELEAAPVHIADLKAILGELPFVPPGAGVPGFEGVGRIVATGPDSSRANGDRVILPMAYGAWSEYCAVPEHSLWRAPEDVPAEQLALVRINLSTAWLLLDAYVMLQPGDWIIQNAANANVAAYVAALAARRGVNVIDIVRRAELVPALQAAGRCHVMVDGSGLADAIAGIANTRPVLALDAIGGAATARLGNVVADDGLVLAYGFLAEQAYALDYPDVMFRNVRLQGMMTDRAMAVIGVPGRERMVAELEEFMASGLLQAEIAGVYTFENAQAALEHAGRTGAGRAGKVILIPKERSQ
jgi:trans-2-enoyl-CoA reductase